MLLRLSINNYALIDKLDIDFSAGFSIIAGETGSGKSILLGALGLIIGQRADSSVLNNKERKCIVEGEFDIKGYSLNSFFDDNQLDYSDITIIRREINESGKSRAFINDTPVNLILLKDIGSKLVDIHSQHHNLMVAESGFQLDVIDFIARNSVLIESYKTVYKNFIEAQSFYNSALERAAKAGADLDYLSFQFDQLEKAGLNDGEQEELEEELQVLSHAGEIKSTLEKVNSLFNGDSSSIIGLLRDVHGNIEKIEPFFHRISDLVNRVQSGLIELKDISDELERVESQTEFDPARSEFVNERLDLLYSLQKKHNVTSVGQLIEIRDDLKSRVDEIANFDFTIEGAKKELERVVSELDQLASKLTLSRGEAVPVLESHMSKLLGQLGIQNPRFVVNHNVFTDFSASGRDKVSFLFSANRQSMPQELGKVASGGEISRVMLSLKSVLAKARLLPTQIFDEIDSGVSGEVAGKVGNIIKGMSEYMQVINITHLPQIAGKGDRQYLVYKEESEKATYTRIRLLTRDERIVEIARMLSSDELTDAALENAKELLGN